MPRFCQGTLEERRARLVAWLSVSAPQGSARNEVTVVFDGQSGFWGDASRADVKVIFTSGESADDYIKQTVEDAVDKKRYVVVSDDKDIMLYARASGTKVLNVKEFAAGLFAASRKRRDTSAPEAKKYLSLSDAHTIDQELKEIWKIK